MNKKKLYEQIMTSVSKEVKKVLNEARAKKYEFSKKDLDEIELLQGEQGESGKSAYEIAVEEAFVGTEQEWWKDESFI